MRRLGLVGLLAVTMLVISNWWASASAHVTVAAPGVTVGAADAAITFRVPDESDTASTTRVQVYLPARTPLAGVLLAPTPGWTAKVTEAKLRNPIHTDDGDITQVVSRIVWRASKGAGIRPGYIGQFTIVAGKLPDHVSSLVFRAIQNYSDGKVMSWVQTAAPGSTAEPAYPAPALHLPRSVHAPTRTPKFGGNTAGWIAVAGAAAGALGTVLALIAICLAASRRRRPRPAPRPRLVGAGSAYRDLTSAGW